MRQVRPGAREEGRVLGPQQPRGSRAISGIATALVGLAVLTGRFGVVRALVIRG